MLTDDTLTRNKLTTILFVREITISQQQNPTVQPSGVFLSQTSLAKLSAPLHVRHSSTLFSPVSGSKSL